MTVTGSRKVAGLRSGALITAALAVAALTVQFSGGVFGPFGTPHHGPAGGGTRLADSSSCTTSNTSITAASDQTATPWEIANAGGAQLVSGPQAATGAGISVAVIDTGANAADPQLAGAITGGQDFSGSGGNYRTDSDGHGTMVASIIAARPAPGNGMTGVAPGAKLLIYREAGCNVPAGNDEDTLASAVKTAVNAGARVINVSQDGCTPNANLQAAVLYAYQHGALVVTSAGNYGDSEDTDPATNSSCGIDPVMYPAAYAPYVLSVGAADQDGNVPSWSETGSYVGVAAPGVGVGALFPDGRIMVDSGTSFAAPYVSGLAALLLQKHPRWTPATLMKVLESTASGHGSWTKSAGWGEVNVLDALKADPTHLIGLFGAGPGADGPASAAPRLSGAAMAPVVAAPPSPSVVNQRKGAYIALAGSLLFVIVALAGTLVARDARRRRQQFPA
ncbi:MAG TPA: S8 family serine peptidase [Actinocrinis sp.]|jgi:type VII secretion-associated serine protease mycosin|uniref:S8 family serine peptidase n=1 Tax=Actinocrinis sp. TaxID=1920516 RepID=UPI002DDD2AA2|nr:S8 family serine peptidase [Actinocrinis sp.]HEV3169990.1 S8 family serine peptidase [Actinocrinis sp.]